MRNIDFALEVEVVKMEMKSLKENVSSQVEGLKKEMKSLNDNMSSHSEKHRALVNDVAFLRVEFEQCRQAVAAE